MLSSLAALISALLIGTVGQAPLEAPGPQNDDSTLLIAVRGEAMRGSSGRSGTTAARPLTEVSGGEALRLGKNARVDLLFNHRWLTFEGTGELRLNRGRWAHPASLRRTRDRSLPAIDPTSPGSQWAPGELREPASEIALETPRETAVRDLRPTLRWSAPGTKRSFRLDLLTVIDGRLEWVETWRGLRTRELRVRQNLIPEAPYLWRVAEEMDGSSNVAEAWFYVRSPERLQALENWIRSMEELRSEDAEDRHVAESLLAVILERAGLLEEAQSSWRALAGQGRSLDLATKKSRELARRALAEPRGRVWLPLPFQIRLDDLSLGSERAGPKRD